MKSYEEILAEIQAPIAVAKRREGIEIPVTASNSLALTYSNPYVQLKVIDNGYTNGESMMGRDELLTLAAGLLYYAQFAA